MREFAVYIANVLTVPVRQTLLRVRVQTRVEQLMPLMQSGGQSVQAAVVEMQDLVLALSARHHQLATGASGVGEEQPEGPHLAEVNRESSAAMRSPQRHRRRGRALGKSEIMLQGKQLRRPHPRGHLLGCGDNVIVRLVASSSAYLSSRSKGSVRLSTSSSTVDWPSSKSEPCESCPKDVGEGSQIMTAITCSMSNCSVNDYNDSADNYNYSPDNHSYLIADNCKCSVNNYDCLIITKT